jgi:GxxExxY protein
MQPPTSADDLTQTVIGLAMKVHRTLGPGFLEHVYRNSLLIELRKMKFGAEVEKPLKVSYEGVIVGEFSADLLIDGWLIVELKAVSTLIKDHEIQLVNYLTAVNQPYGLLLNFGSPSLQYKRKYQRASSNPTPDLKA